jgi:hypothetical protein
VQLADHVAAIDQSFVSFENGVGFAVAVNCHTDNSPHGTVHTGSISTRGEDTNAASLGRLSGDFGGLHIKLRASI